MIALGKVNKKRQTSPIKTSDSAKKFNMITYDSLKTQQSTSNASKSPNKTTVKNKTKKPFQHSPDPYAFLKTAITHRTTPISPITCSSSTSQKTLHSIQIKKAISKQSLKKKINIQLPLETLRKIYIVKELDNRIGSPIRALYQTQMASSKVINKTIGNLEHDLNLSQDQLEKVKRINFGIDKDNCIRSCEYDRLLIENASLNQSIIAIKKERQELYDKIQVLNKETTQMNNMTSQYAFQIEDMKSKQKNVIRSINTIREENKLITTAWMLVLKRRDELSQGRAQLMTKSNPTAEMEIEQIKKVFL